MIFCNFWPAFSLNSASPTESHSSISNISASIEVEMAKPTHPHSGRIRPNRQMQIFSQPALFSNEFHFRLHLFGGNAKVDAPLQNIFITARFIVHSQRNIKQSSHLALDTDLPACGYVNTCQYFKQGAFS